MVRTLQGTVLVSVKNSTTADPLLMGARTGVPHIPAWRMRIKARCITIRTYHTTIDALHLLQCYKQWIAISNWINGETGGYLRVCTESRNWFETDFPNWLKEEPPVITPSRRSEEHGSYIIEALETGRVYRGHFNVINQHHITNLPAGCVIEIPGYVDKNGIQMPVVGDLPLACAATCAASVRVQEMGMEAAVHGNVLLLKQAMLHDPLVGAVCNPEEVWQMTDEMLVAQAQWLPQYQQEVPNAQRRLEEAVRTGTRVKLSETQGAARLPTRTIEELARNRAEARASAAAADKGKMTAPTS